MKKIIIAFICFIFMFSMVPSTVLASEYESLIDNSDFITSEDEEYLQSRIDYIKEAHDYNITLVSETFESKEAFREYSDSFSEYDSDASGAILMIGEYGDSYSYYSIAYGEYTDSLNDAIFDKFDEFDSSSETYTESYEMYITLVQIFLEEQAASPEVVNEEDSQEAVGNSQETSETVEEVVSIFETELIDEADVISDKNKDYFERRIQNIYETYNYKITLKTKDFNYSQNYPDYEKYDDELRSQVKSETSGDGSVIVFAPHKRKDFYFINGHYGQYRDAMNDKMLSFYQIEEYAREDEENIEDMCFYVVDSALDRIENILIEENKPPVKDIEEFIGIGGMIEGFDPMIDAAELFSEEQEEILFARIEEIHNTYDFDVTMITLNEIPDDSYDLREYFDWYEGLDPTRDGLVVGVNMYEFNREFSISARNFGMEAFNDDAHWVIDKEVPPLLTEEEYFKAFNLFLDYTEEFLTTAKAGETYKKPIDIYTIIIFVVALPLILALIIAWVIVKFVFVAQMKTAVIKTQAKEFMIKDSLDLTLNTDVFTHETEKREYDPPSEDNDSGGGGSRTSSSGYGGGRSGSSSRF